MGQTLSSIARGPLDPGLMTHTDPNGFVPLVLIEQPGNSVEVPQSDPSKELSLSSSTTSKKNIDMVPETTEADVLHAGLLQVMSVTGQLAPDSAQQPGAPLTARRRSNRDT